MTSHMEYSFAALPGWVKTFCSFAPSCKLRLTEEAAAAGQSGALELRLLRHGGSVAIERCLVSIGAIRGSVSVTMAGDENCAEIGPGCHGTFDLKLWRNSRVTIGAGTTANYVKIVLADSTVRIGKDCMISDEVLIQAADQHGLLDATTLELLNRGTRHVVIEDHVWLARRCVVMPDVTIGFGSVVAAGCVATADIPAFSVAAGVPGRIVRTGTSWSRSPDGASKAEAAAIEAYRKQQAEVA